jgi:hypothetical protein
VASSGVVNGSVPGATSCWLQAVDARRDASAKARSAEFVSMIQPMQGNQYKAGAPISADPIEVPRTPPMGRPSEPAFRDF